MHNKFPHMKVYLVQGGMQGGAGIKLARNYCHQIREGTSEKNGDNKLSFATIRINKH